MTAYTIRRILWTIPVLAIISFVTFALMHSIPGSPFRSAEMHLPEEVVARLEAHYHLDDPFWKQYLDYVWNALHGNLGPSYLTRGRSVNEIIAAHAPASLELGTLAFFIAISIGIPLGIVAAAHQGKVIDNVSMFVAISMASIPTMVLGPVLILIFALRLRVLPVASWGTWQQAVLPAFTLGLGSSALLARLTRASLLEVISKDYIRTAWAKGLSGRRVILRHAVKNGLLPVVTDLGPRFSGMVTGALVVEQIFGVPGIGKYFVQSITERDYAVIMGTVLLYATILSMANAIVDISYVLIDPRIRYS